MKRRVADLIADILLENNITDLFSVVGGGAMFLNDAFGHREGLRVLFNQHEQACSMAAEGYVRAGGRMAAVCVTTGPGGTNAITGVLGAFQDNYPMLVISGQVRYPTTADSTGLPLRFMGEQEHNIVDTVRPLTKYVVMLKNPLDVRYEMEKAIHLATHGRRGPCWVDVPLDIQSAMIEEEGLRSFVPDMESSDWNRETFLSELRKAKRPVILTGSAIRSAGCVSRFRELATKLNVPVLAATYNADLFTREHPRYYGNFGVNGGRAGNFIVQNADLVIGMGCRMAFRQIGFNFEAFSPNSRRMVIDVDPNELRKPTLRIDVPICADIAEAVESLLETPDIAFSDSCGWLDYCDGLKKRFPVYLEKFNQSEAVNPYFFVRQLQKLLPEDGVIVLGNSSIAGHVLQMGIAASRQRIINNMNCGSMGYDLPAAVGAAQALQREVTLITGDGSMMLNLQELMTVKHYRLPVKIVLCSNGGYRAIVRTQQNMFQGRFTGCTAETGVEMPDFSKVAAAFDIPYFRIENHTQLDDGLRRLYQTEGFALCELMQDREQMIEPRIMSRKLDDGTLVSPVIDDLYPFLDRETYQAMKFPGALAEKQGKSL
ncbi:thiamine pyrophosphate-binding protein [Faecalicatena sp. BF-R-105]|nr:thiamine pyrophosphate-binding protein [Faecalicatena sp. BF-R-105]